jgi:hypothetical protein
LKWGFGCCSGFGDKPGTVAVSSFAAVMQKEGGGEPVGPVVRVREGLATALKLGAEGKAEALTETALKKIRGSLFGNLISLGAWFGFLLTAAVDFRNHDGLPRRLTAFWEQNFSRLHHSQC